jgi:hypothetical protein
MKKLAEQKSTLPPALFFPELLEYIMPSSNISLRNFDDYIMVVSASVLTMSGKEMKFCSYKLTDDDNRRISYFVSTDDNAGSSPPSQNLLEFSASVLGFTEYSEPKSSPLPLTHGLSWSSQSLTSDFQPHYSNIGLKQTTSLVSAAKKINEGDNDISMSISPPLARTKSTAGAPTLRRQFSYNSIYNMNGYM